MIGSDKEVTRLGLEEIFPRLYGTSPTLSFLRDMFEKKRGERKNEDAKSTSEKFGGKVLQINRNWEFFDLWECLKVKSMVLRTFCRLELPITTRMEAHLAAC